MVNKRYIRKLVEARLGEKIPEDQLAALYELSKLVDKDTLLTHFMNPRVIRRVQEKMEEEERS